LTTRPLFFALPDGSDAVSGGNIYNEELARALSDIVAVKTVRPYACRDAIARGEPGVYFVDTLNLADVLAFPERGPEQALVLVVHHLPSLEPGIDAGHESLAVERRALTLFDAFVCTSPFTSDLLIGRGIAPGAVLTVPPPPPAIERQPRAYEAPPRAVVVANLIARKGVLEWLQALAPRTLAGDRFSIDVVGRHDIDSDHARKCRDRVDASPALRERVRFAGAVPHARIGEFYRGANLFVSSAKMETFGMALQEARGWGLPIVALDGGHARTHFTHGQNGLLFSSIEELAEGFLALARDEPRMRRLFDEAQRPAKEPTITWRLTAERLVEQLNPWLTRSD
jgi:glycosyltransferase involved in cell wall biosynthesis